MKKKIINVYTCLMMAVAVLTTSCTSTSQTFAGFAGASLGSNIGGVIGAASSGRHHHYSGQGAALGSLIGMGVGAALGVAIQKSVEEGDRRQTESSMNETYYNAPEQRTATRNYKTESRPVQSLPVRISELIYFDGNGDGLLSKGETIEVETYIKNTSNHTLRNVQIALDTQQSKYVSVSSPLTITLDPGQKVKYSGRVYGKRARRGQNITLTIRITEGNREAQSETLYVEMM